MNPTPENTWEIEFDKTFVCQCMLCSEHNHEFSTTAEYMKSFIRQTPLTQVSACRHAILDKLAKGIEGMKFTDEADRDWLQEWIQENL